MRSFQEGNQGAKKEFAPRDAVQGDGVEPAIVALAFGDKVETAAFPLPVADCQHQQSTFFFVSFCFHFKHEGVVVEEQGAQHGNQVDGKALQKPGR